MKRPTIAEQKTSGSRYSRVWQVSGQSGQEGAVLRYVFGHSVALAVLVGLVVLLQAYVWTGAVP